MTSVTTRAIKPKPFAWSFSRLKSYENCPKRHYEVDIAKNYTEEKSAQLAYGDELHKAAAQFFGKGVPLPKHLKPILEPWRDRITPQGKILVEQQMAITKDFAPTGWFDKDVWCRAVVDLLKLVPPVALVIDWKSGRVLEDATQLALMAACVFAHYPEVEWVRSEFIWLKEEAVTSERYSRAGLPEMWAGIWPRVRQLEHAHKTQEYPPKPGYLCRKWCPVTACIHHGE